MITGSVQINKGYYFIVFNMYKEQMSIVTQINVQNNILDKYFNTSSKEVIIISAIDNNVMELLSSCDFDKNCRLAQ